MAEMSFLGIPKKLLQMMENLKSAERILSSPVDKLYRLQTTKKFANKAKI